MRHAVLGAGGVGGLVGGTLARTGHPVTLLVRPVRQHHYPERLAVESNMLGNFEAPVRVVGRLNEPFDVVWVTVKATMLEAALEAVPEQGEPGRVRQHSTFANVEVAPSPATRQLAEVVCNELSAAGFSCEVSDDE